MQELLWHRGGCHCARVAFEVRLPAKIEVHRCNCSICSQTGFEHLIVPAAHFRLLRGADSLTCYRFNSGVAQHLFCSHCGVKSYYVPRSNPDGFSVNFRCLQSDKVKGVRFADFDGRNWEQNADQLGALSRAPESGEGGER